MKALGEHHRNNQNMNENKEIEENEQAVVVSEDIKSIRKPGRPPGAKNKNTMFKELMAGEFQSTAEKDIKDVLSVLFKKAKNGDLKAIKLVMDRLIAPIRSEDDKVEKHGLVVNITVGSMEQAQAVTLEGEYNEIEDENEENS
jgi:hypothetical protein